MLRPRVLLAALLALVLFAVLLAACAAMNARSSDGGCDTTWGLSGAVTRPVPPPAPRPPAPRPAGRKPPAVNKPRVINEPPARQPAGNTPGQSVRPALPVDVDLSGC
ncbi:hypothetical protein [Streptomyces sp. NRRL B-1347]|uniref:hypothetical protein n=1 Tax=Streptomyces sp. NRRL B-1347 TaxID=1476877 RepID=UPI0004C851A3|nr:hypothetical protein [Streptomyces sp. NRRL B-1347]